LAHGTTDKGTRLVFKIIPIGGKQLTNEVQQPTLTDAYQEICITKNLSDLRKTNGCHFIKLRGAGICKGPYPRKLLTEWDIFAHEKNNNSLNDRPSSFAREQLYAVLILNFGGKDLENIRLRNIQQAQSLIFQTCFSLATAEERFKFEHRDLHLANLLICKTVNETLKYQCEGQTKVVKTWGIKCNIIDYTLSRLENDNELLYTKVPEVFFDRHGDYMFEVCRKMRDLTESDWGRYCPKTNVLWIHHLVYRLLNWMNYQERPLRVDKETLRNFKNRILEYDSVTQLLTDKFFDYDT